MREIGIFAALCVWLLCLRGFLASVSAGVDVAELGIAVGAATFGLALVVLPHWEIA